MSVYADITIERGATFQAEILVEDPENNTVDITNVDFIAVVKNYYNSSVSSAFTVTKTKPTLGIFEIEMDYTTTLALSNGNHVWDILALHPDGSRERLIEGQALVTPPVSP